MKNVWRRFLLPRDNAVANTHSVVASLTARANAVKMLHIRIRLLKSYLNSLPLSYLTTPAPPISDADSTSAPHTDTSTSTPEINHPLLRSILALLSCLPLLLPPAHLSNFHQETLAEKSDVELISLLGSLGRSVKDAREMGRKFGVVENVKSQGKKGYINMGALGEDMWDGEGKDVGSITLTRGEDGWGYE